MFSILRSFVSYPEQKSEEVAFSIKVSENARVKPKYNSFEDIVKAYMAGFMEPSFSAIDILAEKLLRSLLPNFTKDSSISWRRFDLTKFMRQKGEESGFVFADDINYSDIDRIAAIDGRWHDEYTVFTIRLNGYRTLYAAVQQIQQLLPPEDSLHPLLAELEERVAAANKELERRNELVIDVSSTNCYGTSREVYNKLEGARMIQAKLARQSKL